MKIKNSNITNKNIASYLNSDFHGKECVVKTIDSFPNTKRNSVSFLKYKIEEEVKRVQNSTVITFEYNLKKLEKCGVATIISDNPKYDFAKIYHKFFNLPSSYKIDRSLIKGKNVEIDHEVNIGPNVVIGDDVKIKQGAEISPNVVLYKNVTVNKNVKILSGSVIGGRAFSYGLVDEHLSEDSYRMPSIGRVVLEEGVEIGNNCVISRGIFKDTLIKRNTRINDLTHIGNSVVINENTLVMANVDISGKVEIGKNCWIAQSSCIKQGVRIADNVQVGMGSVVTNDVEKDSVVSGSPAKFMRKRKTNIFK